MRNISILGSTGSVGQSTLDLVLSRPDKLKVRVLTAQRRAEDLIRQAEQVKPDIVAIGDETRYQQVKAALPGVKVLAGRAGILEAASQDVDWTMAAIVGCAGLEPVLNSIAHSKTVAIANKEPLVAAGRLVLDAAKKHGTQILPVDSEHNAVFQVFEDANRDAISRIILTASGGPFRTASADTIRNATPEQAVAHPNWSMGAKISVDSATMMNKALEVIEAHYLFALPAGQIDVLLHPQSVIHSMVEYADGSILAQMGAPDMRTPIAYTLAWPRRMATTGQRLDLTALRQLDFSPMDAKRFPALTLAYAALQAGPMACIALNAANEVAVQAFLDRKIGFLDIVRINRATLESAASGQPQTLDEILAADLASRERAHTFI